MKDEILFAVIVFGFACAVYSDNDTLHGPMIYDDAGTVARNPIMRNTSSHWDLWTHDYWGESLLSPTSHKSWRPVTSYTFRFNFLLHGLDTFGYHVVNVLAHAVASVLMYFSSRLVCAGADSSYRAQIGALAAALLFACHPVHVEAVANISGRAEVLGGMFFLAGFVCYGFAVTNRGESTSWRWVFLTVLMTLLSLLSKEHGIVLPIVCALWDFEIASMLDLRDVFLNPSKQSPKARILRQFCFRIAALCASTALMVWWRFEWTGGNEPNFIYDQNPAALHRDKTTRILSVSWLYYLYTELLIFPTVLCCDWSGDSIDLVHSTADHRFPMIVFWYACAILSIFSSRVWKLSCQTPRQRHATMCIVFVLVPFLLSSNLIIAVGFMKAERVMYVPSIGYCMFVGWLLTHVGGSESNASNETHSSESNRTLRLLVLVVFGAYLAVLTNRCVERNHDWSSALSLWRSAYQVNPRSAHIWHNYGLELAYSGDDKGAAYFFEKAVTRNPRDISTWFALGVSLRRIGQCDKARVVMKQALDLLDHLEEDIDDPETPKSARKRERAHLLAGLALCEQNVGIMGQLLHDAIQLDPGNSFAVTQANDLLKAVGQATQTTVNQIPLPQTL